MLKKLKADDGFSLVELSIVLIVIGLILGFALKGQDLIESARIKKTISQINQYKIATSLFYDSYEALPGDYKYAQEHLGKHLKNGNGNGRIDGYGLDAKGSLSGHEAVQFWAHLAAADLIPSPGLLPSSGQATYGEGVPSSSLGGGFTVETDPTPEMNGIWLILGTAHNKQGTGPLLTPAQALAIDQKMDDGNPLNGSVRAKEGMGIPAGQCIKGGRYNGNVKEKVCTLYIKL